MTDQLAEFREIAERDDLRRQISELQVKLKLSKARTAVLVEAVHQGAKDAAVALGNPSRIERPKPDRRTKRSEVALLHLSDLHFGKQTPSFDSQIAAERVKLLASKVLKITEIERADHPVRECHVLLGGDMAENVSIFPGQAFEIDSTLFTQVFAAAQSIEECLRTLLSTFPSVHVWTQTGNHGRIGRKGDAPRRDNVDGIIYRIVKDRLQLTERAPRLVWHHQESWYTIVEIGSYRALLVHGDQIRSFGGNIPAFGIVRKANAWASGVLPPFLDILMGHFHSPMALPLANGKGRAFVNPSIESDSDYAKEFVAATGTPGQRLFYVDPDKGRITSERVIWLDDQK